MKTPQHAVKILPTNHNTLKLRITMVMLFLLGAGGCAIAALLNDQSRNPPVYSADSAVDELIPKPGETVLQQNRVGIVLNPEYKLESLTIYFNDQFTDGFDVTSQVTHVSGINLWQFTPGKDQFIKALSADTNCAKASYVLTVQPDSTNSIEWCFQAS